MKNKNHILYIIPLVALLAAIALVLLSDESVNAAGEPIAVIVNAANPIDNLSVGELRKLFLSDRSHWESGKPVAAVMVGTGAPERAVFLKVVCGMNDADFGKYFVQIAFSGKAVTPPKDLPSSRAVKSMVASSAGAIGFVPVSELSPADAGLKVVKIDGETANDPGYKIK